MKEECICEPLVPHDEHNAPADDPTPPPPPPPPPAGDSRVWLSINIPTVPRRDVDYLNRVVDSILAQLPTDADDVFYDRCACCFLFRFVALCACLLLCVFVGYLLKSVCLCVDSSVDRQQSSRAARRFRSGAWTVAQPSTWYASSRISVGLFTLLCLFSVIVVFIV